MRTLIYKRTHSGDPDPETGVFGNHDCMGAVRGWRFDAVIGIGGVGHEPQSHHIARKLTWIGICPQAIRDIGRGPQLTFHHFWYRGEDGPMLQTNYPALANRMYDKNVRLLVHRPASSEDSKIADLDRNVSEILRLAMDAPPSNGPVHRDSEKTSGKDFEETSSKCSVLPNRACR